MNLINSKLEELRAQYGSNRVDVVTDESNRTQIVVLGKPELLLDETKWSDKEYRDIPEDLKATHKTRIVPIRMITMIGSLPLAGTQALGVKRAGMNGQALNINFLEVKHHTYITFLDNPNATMNAEQIMQSQFGSVEAFYNTAFISFETLDAKIALGPVGMYRLSIAKSDEERYAILNGVSKQAYKVITKPDGTKVRTSELERVTFGATKQPIYRGLLFVDDVKAITADGSVLSAFETYRCGTDIETGNLTYARGTFAQLERNVKSDKSGEEVIAEFNAKVITGGIPANPAFKNVEHPADTKESSTSVMEFDVESAKKADLVNFLAENGGGEKAKLVKLTVEDLRSLAVDVQLAAE